MLNVVLGTRHEGTKKITVVDRISAELIATADTKKNNLVFEPTIDVTNSLKQEIRDLFCILDINIIVA